MMLYSVVLGALVIWRGIWVQKFSRLWKIILSVFVVLISAKFYILRIFGGPASFGPDLPPWILLTVGWFFAVLMFVCVWVVAYEAAWGIGKLLCRLKKWKMPGFFTQPLWRLAGVVPSVILVSVGMYEGLKTPEVIEYTIYVDNLPAEFENLRIIHLADIHADRLGGREKVQKIVDIANAQNGDLIVITGDFVDGRTASRGNDLMPLSGLSAPLGVYGVPGNHEYYSGYDEWLEFLRARGIIMLENSHVMLGENFALGGVTDPAAEHRGGTLPDIDETFAGVPEGAFKLLLAHQPKLSLEAAEAGVDLQLSGHTHGGMVWGLDLLVGMFNHGQVSGEYSVGRMKLYISNGTGIWNGFPIRLGHRSEIVVLTLKRR